MKRNLQHFIWTLSLILISAGSMKAQKTPDQNPKTPDFQPLVKDRIPSRVSADLQQLSTKQNQPALRQSAAKPSLLANGLEKYIQIKGDMVLVDITVNDNSKTALAELEKTGFKVNAAFGRIISGWMPVKALPQLESITSIKFARPAYKPRHQGKPFSTLQSDKLQADVTRPIISQGDTALRSHFAKDLFNVNGNGVKVGILSDSYNNLGGAEKGVQQGELPGAGNPLGFNKPVQVLKDLSDSSGIDEGRGMAEIVHDVAPGAELAFYTAFEGEADFAQGIIALADSGCKVINDDIYYFAEPFFQDGIIAQAIDIVKNRGVTYFSAAGNSDRQSYESDYRPSTFTTPQSFGGTAHNFSAPGNAPVYRLAIRVPIGAEAILSFQWDQPFFSAGGKGAATDMDIVVTDSSGTASIGSYDYNIGGDPVEVLGLVNGTASTLLYVYLFKFEGPDPTRVKFIDYGGSSSFIPTTPAIPGIYAPTLVGHAKAAGAIATAAAPFLWTPAYGLEIPRVEPYSSAGGVPHYFDNKGNRIATVIRRKPEFTSVDGGNTSFFYDDSNIDPDTIPNFFGTSAAAPHAAGIAALIIEAQKLGTITPDQIKGILADRTDDMDDPDTPGFDVGFDFKTGTGLLQADEVVDFIRYPNVYIKPLNLEPACSDNPGNTRNWKVINPNPFEVNARYLLTGLPFQFGDIVVPPGEFVFSTRTLYLGNRPAPNILILEWEDNLGKTSYDISSGTASRCESIVSSENNVGGTTAQEISSKVNIAEVYPNPSTENFRLYLSLAEQKNTGIELYNIEGKLLYKNVVSSNGVVNIEASGYKPGVYILKVKQGQFNKTLKLLKK